MADTVNSLGKCPHCGGDVLWGKFGPYCTNKCGITLKKAYGAELTQEELTGLLNKQQVTKKDCVSKEGKVYTAILSLEGFEEYSFTTQEGEEKNGYRMKLKIDFPEMPVVETNEKKTDSEAVLEAYAANYIKMTN